MMHKIPITILLLSMLAISGQVHATIVEFNQDGLIKKGDEYDFVSVFDDATVGMTGGVVEHLHADDSSTFILFDGDIGWLVASDSSKMYVYGGSIEHSLIVDRRSTVSLFGGTIGQNLTIPNFGKVNIYGYGFEWKPSESSGRNGSLSGYWLGGTPFTISLRDLPEPFPGSQIALIPEPATFLLVLLGGLILRKQNHSR